MSTRCAIIAKIPAGYAGIYVHSDGYPRWTGSILHRCYTSPEKVQALIALGDLSSVGPDLTEENGTVAYHRDNGESWEEVSPITARRLVEVSEAGTHNGHVYLFDGTTWTWNGTPLADALLLPEHQNTPAWVEKLDRLTRPHTTA